MAQEQGYRLQQELALREPRRGAEPKMKVPERRWEFLVLFIFIFLHLQWARLGNVTFCSGSSLLHFFELVHLLPVGF